MSIFDSQLVLRPIRAEDESFLERVYASTRIEELNLTPWNDEQKAAFCRHQFLAQADHYRKHYPEAVYWVIEWVEDKLALESLPAKLTENPRYSEKDGLQVRLTMVGRLYVERWEREIRIMDITLLPEYRGKGFGGYLLGRLQDEARGVGKVLSIHVEKMNPALRLYERMGFVVREDKGLYLLMDWKSEAKV